MNLEMVLVPELGIRLDGVPSNLDAAAIREYLECAERALMRLIEYKISKALHEGTILIEGGITLRPRFIEVYDVHSRLSESDEQHLQELEYGEENAAEFQAAVKIEERILAAEDREARRKEMLGEATDADH